MYITYLQEAQKCLVMYDIGRGANAIVAALTFVYKLSSGHVTCTLAVSCEGVDPACVCVCVCVCAKGRGWGESVRGEGERSWEIWAGGNNNHRGKATFHGLSQQGRWVSFWTPKPLKSTPQGTQLFS